MTGAIISEPTRRMGVFHWATYVGNLAFLGLLNDIKKILDVFRARIQVAGTRFPC